jgi:hypothetical protein
MNKEIENSLKSTFTEKVEALKALQAEGVNVIQEVNDAKASEDAGKLSEASEKFEKVGDAIKAAQADVEAIQEQMGWFKEYQYQDETEVKAQSKEELRKLFDALKEDGTIGNKKFDKTAGEVFADVLKYRGINSALSASDKQAVTSVMFHFGNYDADEKSGAYKNVKSLYHNNGTELLDGSEAVPGFMGVQCGLVEDRNIYCLLDPPADDFEECITRATLNGNRIRFNRETARDSAAAAVYETVYNPYPTFERDGTKPEGSFTIGTSEVAVSKIAEFIVASDEVLEDCGFVASMIDHVLTSNINAEKRRQLIAGLGTGGEMRGILNQPDVLTRTHGDVADGGAVDDNIYDTFRRSLTDIWLQNGSTDNVCAIVHPRELEGIDLLKDEFGRYLFNDSECFTRMLRCIRLRTSVDMPQGTAVLGNFANNWVFYLRKQLEIRMGYTGDQFITNTNTILGEMRGLTLVRCPRKIIKIDGLPATETSPS